MKQQVTRGIVLHRTNYAEADRIVTLLTPDFGKLHLMARGVRRIKAKLAGGVELFSISSISFISGKGEVGTLVSARLEKHFGNIAKDINRTMLGYDLIKQLDKVTEDEVDGTWFKLLDDLLSALDNESINLDVINFWFAARLLLISGYGPNLQVDKEEKPLDAESSYTLDEESMSLELAKGGKMKADQIKFMRLGFGGSSPLTLQRVNNAEKLAQECLIPLRGMMHVSLRI